MILRLPHDYLPNTGCNDGCRKYRASRPKIGSRYGLGQKRCQICEVFIQWDGIWCPCCGCRLRHKPKNRKFKEMLLKIVTVS